MALMNHRITHLLNGLLALLAWVLLAQLTACERQFSGNDPPLRPLVYTELAPSPNTEEELEPERVINIAPEDLGYALFHALVDHDRKAYEDMFISASALSELVRTSMEHATKESARIIEQSELLWTLFSPQLEAEEPLGGLSTRLRLSEFRIGKGRNLAGKIAVPELDEVVQHWGNELRIELLDSDKILTIRVPKIVKTPMGWRIAQVVELDTSLRIYLENGMHLKSDLLTSEHYPYPLEVGNFWKYKVESLIADPSQAQPDEDSYYRDGPPAEITKTEMIKEIIHRQGYWMVRFEQSIVDSSKPIAESTTTSSYSLLVTPRAMYPCGRDCRVNIDNISYLLGYISRQIPIFVFPLEVGKRWHTAARPESHNRYEVRSLADEKIVVPSGAFSQAYVIFGSIEEGREERFFVPGTGVVRRNLRSGAGQKQENLILYRLIL